MAGVIVVAIDGPAGSGKSTLAHGLASSLGLAYVNTGLMYRALTLRALRDGIDPDDGTALAALARELRFDLDSTVDPRSLSIDGRAPDRDLASPDVESSVSRVARHPEVRAVLRAEQRRLGERGAVLEGRDIGSVVFPNATLKIYLEAEPDARAVRRARERKGPEPDHEVAKGLETRDSLDARVNPFMPPEDAVVIDTTGLGPDEVLEVALELVRERTGGTGR